MAVNFIAITFGNKLKESKETNLFGIKFVEE
jgi:hypothetical protein